MSTFRWRFLSDAGQREAEAIHAQFKGHPTKPMQNARTPRPFIITSCKTSRLPMNISARPTGVPSASCWRPRVARVLTTVLVSRGVGRPALTLAVLGITLCSGVMCSGMAMAQQPTVSVPSEFKVHLVSQGDATPFYRDWKVIVAVVGWTIALLSLWWNTSEHRREQSRQHLLESLKWFGGETQPRSIGIAVVEANWDRHDFMRPYWTAVLSTQAIHLLSRSKEENSRVEESNLSRIMAILTRPAAGVSAGDQRRLGRVLDERKDGAKLPSGGISLEHLMSELTVWIEHFPKPG